MVKYSLMLLITWYVTAKLNLTGNQSISVFSGQKFGTGIILGIFSPFYIFLKLKVHWTVAWNNAENNFPWELGKFISNLRQINLITSCISPILSSVSYTVQNLFLRFGVVRNDFCEKIIEIVNQKFAIQSKKLQSVLSFFYSTCY